MMLLLGAACDDGLGLERGATTPQFTWGPASTQLFRPQGGDVLVGDWFPCRDPACARLDDTGFRFDAEGRFFELDAPGRLEPDEKYCVEEQLGTWFANGDSYLLHQRGDREVSTLRLRVEPRERSAIFRFDAVGAAAVSTELFTFEMVRIDPPRDEGSCRRTRIVIDTPPPAGP